MLSGQFLELYAKLKDRIHSKQCITVSPVGICDGCASANNGALFGPDTPGTLTSGINEAIAAAAITLPGLHTSNVSISTDDGSKPVVLVPGVYKVRDSIVLRQGTMLQGSGRASTFIQMADDVSSFPWSHDAIIYIPDGANLSSVRHMSISGRRDEPYWPHEIHGIQLHGYLWRPLIEDVEIVNCQGCGIYVTGDSNNQVVYEPIFSNVSIQSCNWAGMIMTYCADDALYSVNIENCSGEGIRYYGGNGKWYDVHVYLNSVGLRIGGQPLRVSQCSLDTNRYQGAIVESISQATSPGAVCFEAPMAQGNGIAGSGVTASAIEIVDDYCIVNNMIAINKPSDRYQEHAIYRDNQNCQHVLISNIICVDLLGQDIV